MSDTTKKDVEIIKYQKIKDINMSKSSVSEFDKIKKLNLTVEELRAIPRRRGVKNYENLPRIGLVKEINRLYLSKELKKKKILVVYYQNKKEVLNLSLEKAKMKIMKKRCWN